MHESFVYLKYSSDSKPLALPSTRSYQLPKRTVLDPPRASSMLDLHSLHCQNDQINYIPNKSKSLEAEKKPKLSPEGILRQRLVKAYGMPAATSNLNLFKY